MKIRGNTLSKTYDYSQIQRIKSQKWLALIGSPAYYCVVPCFSYWIVLKVLVAIQFRSRDEWRNMPYLAISQALTFSITNRPEGLSEQKTRNRVYDPRKLSIPNDCILSITVFHVAEVLIQWRRETSFPGCKRWWLSGRLPKAQILCWNISSF